jgi:hypothetical protein
MTVLCPVCLTHVPAAAGVVVRHESGPNQICPMSGREPFVWDEPSTRSAVPGRSGGSCEVCGGRAATDMHHRVGRGQGGGWRPANILHLDRGCHEFFTVRPELACELGVSVRRGREPSQVGVHTHQGVVWLSDDIAPPLPGWAR